ncbi:MAG: glycosyltransferase family 39 protein [Steroidobacteraceae bacterium]
MTASAARPALTWIAWAVLALCWFALTDMRPLFEPDEGRYAEIPREMWVSGDWLAPRLNGLLYFEKPPLQYWATATMYSLFGFSEWTARFWSVALAFACLWMVFAFCRRWFASEPVALAAVLVLATNPFFTIIGHINILDSAFAFFMSAAVFAFLLSRRGDGAPASARNWMLVTWAAIALALLSKGLVALVLPGVAIVAYSLLARDASVWRRWQVPLGLPLLLLIAAPWFWMMSREHPGFAEFFFVHEHFARFLTKVHQRDEPWWYFLPTLFLALVLWLPSVVPALRGAWRDSNAAHRLGSRMLLVWCAGVFLFFSLSQSKLPPYVMPIMPALAVLIARQVAADERALRRAAASYFVLIAIVAVGLIVYAHRRSGSLTDPMWWWAGAAVVVAALGWLAWQRLGRNPAQTVWRVVALAGSSMIAWQLLFGGYAAMEPRRTARHLVDEVRSQIGPRTHLYSVGQYRQSIPPYLGRTLDLQAYTGEMEYGLNASNERQATTAEHFAREWQGATDAVAFIEPGMYEELRAAGLPGEVIASDRRSIVLRRQPLADSTSEGRQ